MNPDELITGHRFSGLDSQHCGYIQPAEDPDAFLVMCNQPSSLHADPGDSAHHLINTSPHDFASRASDNICDYAVGGQICGYPIDEHLKAAERRARAVRAGVGAVVRLADTQQYAREPMPDAARRGPTVSLIDAPTDPLGTLAVLSGIYSGKVHRSKASVTDDDRRAALAAMRATVLDGPLEAIQFTFLVEGVSRSFTHQAVRNRFSFFAQESLRFAVADDWAQEIPLPPSLTGLPQDHPLVSIWRKAHNQSEDNYAALVGNGMPAEEARDVLTHAITTRLYWTVSLRTLLQEAGKRTCTQAQFVWRVVMGQVAKALRERYGSVCPHLTPNSPDASACPDKQVTHSRGPWGAPWRHINSDGWQYEAFAALLRPACYQKGACAFKAEFDRACTIRERVDMNERAGRPSKYWDRPYEGTIGTGPNTSEVVRIEPINDSEWAADPAAARLRES